MAGRATTAKPGLTAVPRGTAKAPVAARTTGKSSARTVEPAPTQAKEETPGQGRALKVLALVIGPGVLLKLAPMLAG